MSMFQAHLSLWVYCSNAVSSELVFIMSNKFESKYNNVGQSILKDAHVHVNKNKN